MSTPTEKTFRILRANGVRMEPLNEALVMELVRKGELCAEDQIQRMGSDRWRTIIQLAPHLFVAPPAILASEQLAYEEECPSIPPFSPSVDADAPIELSPENEWMRPTGPLKPNAGRMEEDDGIKIDLTDPSAMASNFAEQNKARLMTAGLDAVKSYRGGKVSKIAIIAWIFAGLLAFESFRQVDVLVEGNDPESQITAHFRTRGYPPFGMETFIVEIVRPWLQGWMKEQAINAESVSAMNQDESNELFKSNHAAVRAGAVAMLLFRPHVFLALIPGGLLFSMLIRLSPERDRLLDARTMWWCWTTWISAPILGIIAACVLPGFSITALALVLLGASALTIPGALIPRRMTVMLRGLLGDDGHRRFFRLGATASLLLLIGFGGCAVNMGIASIYPTVSDLTGLFSAIEVAGIACMAWWATELAILIPKIAAVAEAEAVRSSKRRVR